MLDYHTSGFLYKIAGPQKWVQNMFKSNINTDWLANVGKWTSVSLIIHPAYWITALFLFFLWMSWFQKYVVSFKKVHELMLAMLKLHFVHSLKSRSKSYTFLKCVSSTNPGFLDGRPLLKGHMTLSTFNNVYSSKFLMSSITLLTEIS